jgi:hypothetical protein
MVFGRSGSCQKNGFYVLQELQAQGLVRSRQASGLGPLSPATEHGPGASRETGRFEGGGS